VPAPGRFKVYMTEFGGKGDRESSAYGGIINPRAFEVSLPCKVAAEKRVVAVYRGARSVICRVNDVGPWNMHDDYWNRDGVPRSIAQKVSGERAEDGLVPSNPAGLDATPAVFDELGITGPESTRGATVEWEFVPRTINPTDEEKGDHLIPPPPPPPPPATTAALPWWQQLLAAFEGRKS
jgi:hypothetical protein